MRDAENMYHPFADKDEWELAKSLARHLTIPAVDEFLRLKWPEPRERPSFVSAAQMLGWMDGLPSGPAWRCTNVNIPGCETSRPIHLMWRDAREVVEDILRDPVFARHMTFKPHVVVRNSSREYGEFFTGDRAHHIQDQLPQGATVIPIMISSEKTIVSRRTGELEIHPVFVTIGNIRSNVRMHPSSYAWRCVAFIPTPEFLIHPEYQTLLASRLFHKCMDIVFDSLKQPARTGAAMTDSLGNVRNCFTPLIAYIADLSEQQLVAGVAKNASPVTTATLSEFGDSSPHPPRCAMITLQQILDLCSQTHPWDIVAFQEKAKAIGLLGVHLPFWRNWKFANPMYFLVGEILHSSHKFVFDHVLKWCKEVAGSHVLDSRYKTQHKRVGVKHFNSGVSHINQMTGREHRDIQRTLVPMLVRASPAVTPLFVYCVRSIIEFVRWTQSPTHTDASLASMVEALREFHRTKDAILKAKARRGANGAVKNDFNVPILERFQSFSRHITNNGTLIQYNVDVTERLHTALCKIPFELANQNVDKFIDQVVILLNREENIRRFDLYHILRGSNAPLKTTFSIENKAVAGIDPTLLFIYRTAPNEMVSFSRPRPSRSCSTNLRSYVSSDGMVAFHVTIRPDATRLSVAEMQATYHLPRFIDCLDHHIRAVTKDPPNLSRLRVDIWHKFRIQQQYSSYTMKSQVIQAYPCSTELPFGLHDVVLVKRKPGVRVRMLSCVQTLLRSEQPVDIAQVKAIFRLRPKKLFTKCLLLFVDLFMVIAKPTDDREGVGLYRVRRPPSGSKSVEDSQATCHAVIPVTSVVQPVELIPVFDTVIPGVEVSSENCLQAYDEYYVHFADVQR